MGLTQRLGLTGYRDAYFQPEVVVCARLMQLQKLKGRIEWHNALQACDLEEILQVSAAGKAAAMLSLPQKSHSNLCATGK